MSSLTRNGKIATAKETRRAGELLVFLQKTLKPMIAFPSAHLRPKLIAVFVIGTHGLCVALKSSRARSTDLLVTLQSFSVENHKRPVKVARTIVKKAATASPWLSRNPTIAAKVGSTGPARAVHC